MRNNRMKQLLILTFILFNAFSGVKAKANSEKSSAYNLFRIERSRSIDQVIYDLNLNCNGNIKKKNPISVYWQNPNNKETRKLTPIHNKYGYGIKCTDCFEHSVIFKIKAIPDQLFKVVKTNTEDYQVYTYNDNEELLIDFIYIKFIDGTVWVPDIEKIEINAFHPLTMKTLTKVISQK